MSVFQNMEQYHHDYYLNSPSVLSSPSSVYSMNTDGNIRSFPMSGNVSPLSSRISPVSSSDSSSAYNFQHLQISSNVNGRHIYQYLVNSMSTRMEEPFLEIIEQPIDKFRFRYKSEMRVTHGILTGEHSKKTFPSVRLRNWNGEALIRCSLHQILKPGHEISFPHSHSLVVRCGNEGKSNPHEVMVSQLHGYKATFQGMGIIHATRRFLEDELFEKLVSKAEFESGQQLTKHEQETLRSKAKKHSTDMNLNQVSLCFEAYECANGKWIRLCEPIFSNPINNKKSPLTGELKINRLSTVVGSAAGNDDLFMFVEKVKKENIEVRFFEQDDDQLIWEDWGKFTEADVHRQYAIALKTPPYRNTNIDESVKVYIQLYRPGDEAISEPVEFRYKPSYNMNSNRKRPRVASFYDTDIPVVVAENTYIHNSPDSYEPQNDNMIDDTDIEQIFPDLFKTNESELALNPEDFSSLLHTLNENSDFDKLAKDSVESDDDHAQSPKKQEKWITQFLDKIDPLLQKTANAERFKIYRKFCKYIFHTFNSESMVYICVKSDDSLLLDRLWKVLHKFELYELLNERNYNNETCLHLAAAINKINVIEELIKYGVEVNAIDADGNTALHTAIQENYNIIILHTNAIASEKYLMMNLSILSDNGYTPLHLASMKNNLKAVKMLNTKAAETKKPIFNDVEGKHGNNALHIPIESILIRST